MLLKYTLKNMFAKPGRLFLLMLCIFAACFTALLALDMSSSVKNLLHNFLSNYTGSADYMVTEQIKGLDDSFFASAPECDVVYFQYGMKTETTRTEKLYTYALSEHVSVYGLSDLEKSYKIGLIQTPLTLAEDEIAVNRKYAEKYDIHVGDPYTFTDYNGDPFTVTVREIIDGKGFLFQGRGATVICNIAVTNKQNNSKQYSAAFVDVVSDDYEAFEAAVKAEDPTVELNEMYIGEMEEDIIGQISLIFYLLFVLTFILVIFVTFSFTEKIITERMSVIGTLRSVGISRRKATFILILENVMYGLVGSIAAVLLYSVIRPVVLESFLTIVGTDDGSAPDFADILSKTPVWVYIAVIAGAVLLEVLSPLAETLRAVKKPIRDIIFANQDTEYQVSAAKTVIGAVLIAAGLLLGFLLKNMAVKIIAILLIVIGAACVVQMTVRFLSGLLQKLFARLHMPVAEFAALETGSKKCNMGNTILAVTTLIAASAIFIIGSSFIYWMDQPGYDTDVIISGIRNEKDEEYMFLTELDGVKEYEFTYETNDSITFNDEESNLVSNYTVCAQPLTGQLLRFHPLPSEPLAEDEVLMASSLARKNGFTVGDTIHINFRNYGFFPISKDLKLVGTYDLSGDLDGGAMMIAPALYHSLYGHKADELLIRSDQPEHIKELAENALTGDENVRTASELAEEEHRDNAKLKAALWGVVAAMMILTLIGISGNQLIGFEGRRKEYALLHSTAMPRRKLSRLILLENAFTFACSVLLAVLFSIPVTMLISHIFDQIDAGITLVAQFGAQVMFCLFTWCIVMLTALSPIRMLRRMNTAQEIKYE